MKIRYIIKSCILFLMTVFAVFGFASECFSEPTENLKRHHFDDAAFSIELPEDWNIEVGEWEKGGGIGLFSKLIECSTSRGDLISLRIAKFSNKWTTNGLAEIIIGALNSRYVQSKILDESEIVLDTATAKRAKLLISVREEYIEIRHPGDFNTVNLLYFITRGDVGYIIICVSLEKDFPDYGNLYEAVGQSFRIEGDELNIPQELLMAVKTAGESKGKIWIFFLYPLTIATFFYLMIQAFTHGEFLPPLLETVLLRVSIAIFVSGLLAFISEMADNSSYIKLIPAVIGIICIFSIAQIIYYKYFWKLRKPSYENAWICRKCGFENNDIEMECYKCHKRRENINRDGKESCNTLKDR